MQPIVALRAAFLLLIVLVIQGTVSRVKDGDTVVVNTGDGSDTVCRLYAIDAPERNQPFGPEATEALKGMLEGESVRVGLTGDRSYGREMCIIEIDGKNINAEMLRRGMAWAARPYLKTESEELLYIGAESEARQSGLGLWSGSDRQPPWEWRKGKREGK